jgi:phage terminase small subunit|tara:strand:+ start:359 stop:937 length:579 start_codon:yes stop_codon:yes gene_type:complete
MAKHYLGGSVKSLTSAQIKFSQLLVYGVEGSPITKTEAARLAGYTTSPDSQGARLTNPDKFPLVCAYISNLRDEVRQKYGITFERHLEELGNIRDRAKKDNRNLAAAATTEIARGKVAGYYIDQKIIRHGKIDDLNLDQLYERMRTIKEKNEKVLEAKKLLNSSEESTSESKPKQQKKLPLPQQTSDPDSTS